MQPRHHIPPLFDDDHQDPRSTSHFSKALAKELGIIWNLSMAYHLQTDSLMERKNQWVEQYLCLIIANQEDWAMALPIATLVHNNAKNGTMGFSPNKLLIGREPSTMLVQGEGTQNPLVKKRVEQLKQQQILTT